MFLLNVFKTGFQFGGMKKLLLYTIYTSALSVFSSIKCTFSYENN